MPTNRSGRVSAPKSTHGLEGAANGVDHGTLPNRNGTLTKGLTFTRFAPLPLDYLAAARTAALGFYDREDTVMVSSVFAEDETAHEVSRYQLKTMTDYVAKYGR